MLNPNSLNLAPKTDTSNVVAEALNLVGADFVDRILAARGAEPAPVESWYGPEAAKRMRPEAWRLAAKVGGHVIALGLAAASGNQAALRRAEKLFRKHFSPKLSRPLTRSRSRRAVPSRPSTSSTPAAKSADPPPADPDPPDRALVGALADLLIADLTKGRAS